MADQPQPSRFLALPPELRNRIYEHVLIENQARLIVTPTLKPPPLLLSCTQVRSEALALWYTNNSFQIRVHNCDGTLHIKWGRHCVLVSQSNGLDLENNMAIQYNFTGGANWKNLLAWLEACHLNSFPVCYVQRVIPDT